jgi:hypothetical protein
MAHTLTKEMGTLWILCVFIMYCFGISITMLGTQRENANFCTKRYSKILLANMIPHAMRRRSHRSDFYFQPHVLYGRFRFHHLLKIGSNKFLIADRIIYITNS